MSIRVIKVKFDDLPKTRVPVYDYCRQLLKDGEDYYARLEIYRNHEEPDVIVKSIGRAAEWTVEESVRVGPRLRKFREMDQSVKERINENID